MLIFTPKGIDLILHSIQMQASLCLGCISLLLQ